MKIIALFILYLISVGAFNSNTKIDDQEAPEVKRQLTIEQQKLLQDLNQSKIQYRQRSEPKYQDPVMEQFQNMLDAQRNQDYDYKIKKEKQQSPKEKNMEILNDKITSARIFEKLNGINTEQKNLIQKDVKTLYKNDRIKDILAQTKAAAAKNASKQSSPKTELENKRMKVQQERIQKLIEINKLKKAKSFVQFEATTSIKDMALKQQKDMQQNIEALKIWRQNLTNAKNKEKSKLKIQKYSMKGSITPHDLALQQSQTLEQNKKALLQWRKNLQADKQKKKIQEKLQKEALKGKSPHEIMMKQQQSMQQNIDALKIWRQNLTDQKK